MALDNYERSSYLVPFAAPYEWAAQDQGTDPFGCAHRVPEPHRASEMSVLDLRPEHAPRDFPNVETHNSAVDIDFHGLPSPGLWTDHRTGGASDVSATSIDTSDTAPMEVSRMVASSGFHHGDVLPAAPRNSVEVAISGVEMGKSLNDSWNSHLLVYGGPRMQPVTSWEAYYLRSLRAGEKALAGGRRTPRQLERRSSFDQGGRAVCRPRAAGRAETGAILLPQSDPARTPVLSDSGPVCQEAPQANSVGVSASFADSSHIQGRSLHSECPTTGENGPYPYIFRAVECVRHRPVVAKRNHTAPSVPTSHGESVCDTSGISTSRAGWELCRDGGAEAETGHDVDLVIEAKAERGTNSGVGTDAGYKQENSSTALQPEAQSKASTDNAMDVDSDGTLDAETVGNSDIDIQSESRVGRNDAAGGADDCSVQDIVIGESSPVAGIDMDTDIGNDNHLDENIKDLFPLLAAIADGMPRVVTPEPTRPPPNAPDPFWADSCYDPGVSPHPSPSEEGRDTPPPGSDFFALDARPQQPTAALGASPSDADFYSLTDAYMPEARLLMPGAEETWWSVREGSGGREDVDL